MSVLVYIETENRKIKKSAFEVISYARDLAQKQMQSLTAVVVNSDCLQELSQYGVNHLIRVEDNRLDVFQPQPYFELLSQIVDKGSYKTLIFSSLTSSKVLASMLAARYAVAYVPNVNGLLSEQMTVNRSIFGHKIYCTEELLTQMKIISIAANSYQESVSPIQTTEQLFAPKFTEKSFGVKVEKVEKYNEKVSLSEASIVVSGGRGMKSGENWKMLEDLADELGAALACSKPVSDMGWRPHSEHVGQTGKQISPSVYIAVGISGAIQHLAGVESSKVKVVINSDPEAPFFKSADYGVIGDAFEVVPQLIKALKS